MMGSAPGDERYCFAGAVASLVAPLPAVATMWNPGATGLDAASTLFALLIVTLSGFQIAFLHFGLLGLPAYLVLRRYRRPGWLISVLAGMLIGGVPFGLVAGVAGFGFGAVCGAAGGLAFWLALRLVSPPPPPAPDFEATFG